MPHGTTTSIPLTMYLIIHPCTSQTCTHLSYVLYFANLTLNFQSGSLHVLLSSRLAEHCYVFCCFLISTLLPRLLASHHSSPLGCGYTSLFGVSFNRKASFSDTTGSHHWRCVHACVPVWCIGVACGCGVWVCMCMRACVCAWCGVCGMWVCMCVLYIL